MKRFLHVGCGEIKKHNTTREFAKDIWEEVRLDVNPALQPDTVASMADLSCIED